MFEPMIQKVVKICVYCLPLRSFFQVQEEFRDSISIISNEASAKTLVHTKISRKMIRPTSIYIACYMKNKRFILIHDEIDVLI